MKPTITNPTIRKTAAWISKHRYGFLQTVFFLLLVLSLIWLEGKELHNLDERNVWTRIEGYASAFFISSFNVGLFFSDAWPKFRAFNCAVLFGYLLAMVWCAYWAISYVFPAIAAIVMTALYMDIRTDDQQTSKKTIIAAIVAWFFSGFVISILFSKSGYETDLKNQEYANQAIEIAPIKAVDCKDSYIYTEEYGLEKMYTPVEVPKGSKVHRLPLGDEGVFIVVE